MESGNVFTSENLQQLHQLCHGNPPEEKSYTDKLLQILQSSNYEAASNFQSHKNRVDEYKTRLGRPLTFEGIRFLEKFYQRHKTISTSQIATLARNLKVAPARIKKWIRKRAKKDEIKENTENFEGNVNTSEASSSHVGNPCTLQEYSPNQNAQYPWNFAPYNFSQYQPWTPYVSDNYTNTNYPSDGATWAQNPSSTPSTSAEIGQTVSSSHVNSVPDHSQGNFYFNVLSPWQENGINANSDGLTSNYSPANFVWTNNLEYFPQ